MILFVAGLTGILASVLLLAAVNLWLNRKGKQLRCRIWQEYR